MESSSERGAPLWPWVVAVLVVIALLFMLCNRSDEQVPEESAEEETAAESVEGVPTRSVIVHFGAADGEGLVAERREIALDRPEREAFALLLLAEIGRGPASEGAYPVLPPATEVRSVFFDDLGILYVDFRAGSFEGWAWGSSSEILAIRSVVRSLAAAFPEVERIRFLVDGEAVESIGGHVDALHPFEVAEWR